MSHQKTSSSPPGRDDQGTFIPLIHNQKQLHIATSLHTKRKRPPQQPTLFQYLPQSFRHRYGNKSDELCNELWGDNFTFKHPNTIRIWYTNPCGLGLNPTSTKSHNTFSFMYHRSQSDILSLAETNLRWPSLQNNSRLNHRVRSFSRISIHLLAITVMRTLDTYKEVVHAPLHLIKLPIVPNALGAMLLALDDGPGSSSKASMEHLHE